MLVRVTDPQPSVEAAVVIAPKLTELQAAFMAELRTIGPSTANEVAESISTNFARRNSLRRRASDLVKLGLVVAQQSRICRVSGRSATVYVAV